MKTQERSYRRLLACVAVATVLNPFAIASATDTPAAPSGTTNVGVAQAAPEPVITTAPVYGDLSHLTFTATSDLQAQLVDPVDGSSPGSASPVFDVSTGRGGGVELSVNGEIMPFRKIGRRTVNNKTGETHYFYYGVNLDEGANKIVITPLGADGMRGESTTATVYGPGRAVRLDSSIVGSLIADGKTPAIVHIVGYDRNGRRAASGTLVRLTIVRGDAHFLGSRRDATGDSVNDNPSTLASPGVVDSGASPDPATAIAVPQSAATPFPFASPGIDATTATQIGESNTFHAVGDSDVLLQTIGVTLGNNGEYNQKIVPGLQPGELRIRAETSSTAVESQVYVGAALRKPMVLGLATTGIGSLPGVPGEDVTAANNVNARRGRIAIYGVGQITKTAQVQIAYDTADVLEQTTQYGGNIDDPQDRTYQTYGDASTRRDDALSRDHLYARIDSKRSNAMWGEFQANTSGSTGDGYSQLVAGAKVEIAGNNTRVMAFNAHNDVAYSRQVFSPTGLATLGALLHPDIVVGSDIISVVTLDRRTGAVIAQSILSRNVDYTIDYGTGSIYFINPPLPFDLNFNPQQILAEYEYDGQGGSETSGGRIESGIGGSQAVRIGAGYVNDSTGAGNYTLFGQDITGKLSGGGWTLSHEVSKGSLDSIDTSTFPTGGAASSTQQGNAYRATFSDAFGANHVSANFDATSPGFSNPFGGISTAGLLDYRVAYQRLLGKGSDSSLSLSFDHEQNNVAGGVNASSNASLLLTERVTSRVKLRGGLNVINSTGTATVTNSALANQISTVPVPSATAAASAATTSGTGQTTQIDLGADYKIAPQVDLGVDRITSLGGVEQSSQPSQTTAQLTLDLPHRGKAYIRQLWADAPIQTFASSTTSLTGAASSTRSTAIGVEQAVGTNTTVDSEYSVENTGSGSDIYSSIGGRERFNLGTHLHGDLQIQHAASIGSSGGSFDLYGLSLAYAAGSRFRATTNYQLRTGSSDGYTLDVGAVGALSDNVSAVVSSQNSSTAGYNNVDDRVSFAYRPSLNDRAVTIVGFEAQDGNVSALGEHTQLLSLEELYRPDRMLEIAGRYAYKLDGDSYYPAHSSLFGLRVTQRIGHRFDVAGETRYLSAHDIPGATVAAFALEAGYRVGSEMRIAAGYNFAGSPDPSLALAPTRRGVYATATSVIDRIFGWGKDDNL
jgi:hypothetical protein